jgi:hypothetical protein
LAPEEEIGPCKGNKEADTTIGAAGEPDLTA